MRYSIIFKTVRKAKGLRQVEMAKRLGCTQGTISKIESGSMKPEVDVYITFLKTFDIYPFITLGSPKDFKKSIKMIDRFLRESIISAS